MNVDTLRRYWDSVCDWEHAPPEENLDSALAYIARWKATPTSSPTTKGVCDDCGTAGRRWQVGQFSVCRRCANLRGKAGEKA